MDPGSPDRSQYEDLIKSYLIVIIIVSNWEAGVDLVENAGLLDSES